jgi:hypothetical protein
MKFTCDLTRKSHHLEKAMSFGSLMLTDPNHHLRQQEIYPKSVEIRGKQIVGVCNFVVVFKYDQPTQAPMRGVLYILFDHDICLHDLKYSCEGKDVELVCRESKTAKDIFKAAGRFGDYACLVNRPEDRVSKIELGNLPPGSEIILSMNMTLLAHSSSPNSIFFKFPFESCSPKGIIVTLDFSKIESFLFEHEIEGLQEIESVSSNLGGSWISSDSKSGLFRLTELLTDSSLIPQCGLLHGTLTKLTSRRHLTLRRIFGRILEARKCLQPCNGFLKHLPFSRTANVNYSF